MVNVAGCPIVAGGTDTVGAPVRVGSNANVHVGDQPLDCNVSVVCTCHENWVTAPPAAARSVPTGTTRAADCPAGEVSWFGSVDAMTLWSAVRHSSYATPRLPPSRSD